MPSRTYRSCTPVVAAAFAFTLICDGVLGAVVPIPIGGTTGPVHVQTVRQVRRLTKNKVRDARPFISIWGTIYWERFGGDQGDTEVFSFNIDTGTRARRTRNKLDDKLQSAGLWISSTPSLLGPFGSIVDLTTQMPSVPALRIRNRDNRRREIFAGSLQITDNKRFETSVQVAENSFHGMVWLSKKIPRGSTGFGLAPGFDVFRLNGRNKRITRLTDTPNATSVAFGGPWAAWTTTAQDELILHHIRTGETRTLATDAPVNIELDGRYVKYVTSQAQSSSSLVRRFGVVDLSKSPFESRVRVYDIVSDTTITVGDDPSLGYHRDFESVLSDQYVAYNRSFQNPFSIPIPQVHPFRPPPPELTELRLFDLDTQIDLLVTDGRGIAGLQIDDTTLVWQMLDTSAALEEDWDLEIFTYDILRGILRQVTDNNVDDLAPQVSGENIVWTTRLANGETEIFYERSVTVPQMVTLPFPPDLVLIKSSAFAPASQPAQVVVAVVPEPASLMLMSLAGLFPLGRRRSRRRDLA